jgi:hypothetical protein
VAFVHNNKIQDEFSAAIDLAKSRFDSHLKVEHAMKGECHSSKKTTLKNKEVCFNTSFNKKFIFFVG